ncbi:EscU/YscU/HrcU family type III secretion system export apparatus switch protein [Exiguobacterium sp. s80]|uniref:EscU/YscU/HrcU family type III secretion system export apparatus switch protein n=1 Tax=Exiguobacterium sp. s80 TaxID=2751209 RepID=UPI001BE8C0AB|nr:EscU/YscU/HrcU family type III secretion system export apparatus switch protein [Exiguobacterium sp. s80]
MKKAIALSYEEQMAAPKVVAKGSEVVAERILEEAIRHNIPIRQDQTLVTLLDAIEVSEQVPPELYGVIAELFAFLYQLDHEGITKK